MSVWTYVAIVSVVAIAIVIGLLFRRRLKIAQKNRARLQEHKASVSGPFKKINEEIERVNAEKKNGAPPSPWKRLLAFLKKMRESKEVEQDTFEEEVIEVRFPSQTLSATPAPEQEDGGSTPPPPPPRRTRRGGGDDGEELPPFPIFGVLIALVLFASIGLRAIFYWSDQKLPIGVNLGELILGLQLAYILLSVRIVTETEIGVLSFLGRPIAQVRSGPVFAPLGLIRLLRFPVGTFQIEVPGDPEKVVRHDDEPLGPGMKRPVRIIHPEPQEAIYYEPDDLDGENPKGWVDLSEEERARIPTDALGRRAVSEVNFIVRLRIRDAIRFIRVVGDMEEALRQIEDSVVQSAQSILGVVTPGHLGTRLEIFNRKLKKAVEGVVGERGDTDKYWGVDVVDASVKKIEMGRGINEALRDRNAELARKEQTVTKAEGERKATILAAEGTREATILEAQGKAEAITTIAKADAESLTVRGKALAEEGAQTALMAETLKSFDKSNLILVPATSEGLTNVAAMVTGMLKKNGESAA